MIVVAESTCILIAMLPLVMGYFQSHLALVGIGCLILGMAWLLSQRRSWVWLASLGLFIFGILAGMGEWIGLSPILMAISIIGSLLAWDLTNFSRRLQRAAPEDDLRQLEKHHLLQLAGLMAASLSLVMLALFLHVRISFGWMFLLALAGIMGLVQLVKRLRRGG